MRHFIAWACCLLFVPALAAADDGGPEVHRLQLSPQAEPAPALKYFLLPDVGEWVHDNAATYYYKAMAFEGRDPLAENDRVERIAKWRELPIGQLPLAEVASELAAYKSMFAELRRASLCDHCQWNDNIRENGFYTLLPQIQKLRAVARVVDLKARNEIAQGKFDEALATLRIGLAIARHAADGESLIHGLVGIAIGTMMLDSVQELAAAPGSPNMYWALTALPRPFIDCRKGYASERWGLAYTFHEMRDLQSRRLSVEEANNLAGKLFSSLPDLGDPNANLNWQKRLAAAGMVTFRYPTDKAALIAAGRAASEVEELPAAQVVLMRMLLEFDEVRDNVMKWSFVPYHERLPSEPALDYQALLRSNRNALMLLIPAFSSVRNAVTRSERNIDRLRVIEAIRLYAAANQGRLPANLAAIDAVPVPSDPASGQPFPYRVENEQAVMEIPANRNEPIHRYELRIRK